MVQEIELNIFLKIRFKKLNKEGSEKVSYSKLIGRIIEKFGSRRAFAKAVGFAENTISKKLSGKMAITTDDIIEWSKPELLDIQPNEYHEFYFTPKVQETEQGR